MIEIEFGFFEAVNPELHDDLMRDVFDIVKRVFRAVIEKDAVTSEPETSQYSTELFSYATKRFKCSSLTKDHTFVIHAYGYYLEHKAYYLDLIAHIYSMLAKNKLNNKLKYKSMHWVCSEDENPSTIKIHNNIELSENWTNGLVADQDEVCPLTQIPVVRLRFPAKLSGAPHYYDLFHLYRALFNNQLPVSPVTRQQHNYNDVIFIDIQPVQVCDLMPRAC